MLSNFSQYSPQGLIPPQGAGWPQMSPGLFGQPGANSGNASFPHESGQGGLLSPQLPYGLGGQATAFAQNPFGQSPFATPHMNSQLSQGYPVNNPLPGAFAGPSAAHNPQHVIAFLGQLAQQFSIHSAVTLQIGVAIHQLVQQLLTQSSAGALAAGGSQYFGQSPFAGAQGGYGGINPQAGQIWGANRPQTIQ
jgi:hypothetical protein